MDWLQVVVASIPLALGWLVTLAWRNSHRLAVLTATVERQGMELAHLRALIEQRMLTGQHAGGMDDGR